MMKLVDAHARLLGMNQDVFRTADAAACLNIANSHASKILSRLEDAGHILKLARGLWGLTRTDHLALPMYLTAPYPSYISLQSALYHHGMISQIPNVIYAVSLARTRRFQTPLATVSIHHIAPTFFFGFEPVGTGAIRMATPEKALLDFLYLSQVKTKLFCALPELDLPERFDIHKAGEIINRIEHKLRRTTVSRLFDKLMQNCHGE